MALKGDAKFVEKLTCGLENDASNMVNFHQSTWKTSKLGLWWDPFIQSKKFMSLKFTDECVSWHWKMCHDNEDWCKTWRGIDLSFQNCYEEFDKFWPDHSKI